MNRGSPESFTPPEPGRATPGRLRVWDLPTRLFHGALIALVAVNLYTGNVGGLAEMDLHMLSGMGILTLVLFRLAWGVVGNRTSRFASFVCGPGTVIRYARSLLAGSSERTYGHNPLGGWSVVAMLAALLLQAVTGLFANDDIFTEGPLARTVDKGTSDLLTAVHDINALILYGLIGLHVTVVLAYLLLKGENLIRPMITGWTVPRADLPPGTGPSVGWGRALLLLVLAAGAVSLIGG